MMIRQSIGHGFANLAKFAGRDRPGTFWPFASLLLGLAVLAWFVAVGWQLVQVFEKMGRFANEHPDQVTVTQGPGHYSMQVHGCHPELAPDFGSLIGVMAGLCLILALVLAAAVVRRLHDSNVGGWAALPPPILLFSGLWL